MFGKSSTLTGFKRQAKRIEGLLKDQNITGAFRKSLECRKKAYEDEIDKFQNKHLVAL